jgi:hypothetical protein
MQSGKNGTPAPTRPSVEEVLDQAWLEEGMSREELEQNRRLADIFDCLLATGRTADDINAEWERKTPQEILCEYASLVEPEKEPAFAVMHK